MLIEAKNVTKAFGATIALREINLKLEAGRFHALLGENGAGKSTLIKILAGIHRPTSGEILLEDERIEAGKKPVPDSNYADECRDHGWSHAAIPGRKD